MVKDVKKDYLDEENDESEPEPEPYHRGDLSEHERHLAPKTLAPTAYALQLLSSALSILCASFSFDGADLVAYQLSQRACIYRAGFRVSVPNATIKLP